jgi:hypothetical protein
MPAAMQAVSTADAILLGRLGAELVLTDSCMPLDPPSEPTAAAYRDVLGCPSAPSRELVGTERLNLRTVPLVIQRFEGGALLWLREFASDVLSDGAIFVIAPGLGGQELAWQRFLDPWREGQPTGVVDLPPAGRYAPQRGFGSLWAGNAQVRAQLGWALAPEQGETGGYRRFQRGFLLYRPAVDQFFVVSDDGLVRDVPRR